MQVILIIAFLVLMGVATMTAVKPARLTPELEALAVKWANTFGAPPSLLVALMAIESSYNPRAKNTNDRAMQGGGAWGLTQLLLTSAEDETKRYPADAKKHWPQWDGTGEGLLDANTHLAIAAHKLARNWARYRDRENRWLTAGVSWHQGTGNVDKQIERGGGRVNPSNLPTFGKEYWNRLERQRTTNLAVVTLMKTERFSYA